MLAEWIAPLDVETFFANHLGRGACAQTGSTTAAVGLLDWRTLDRVLAVIPAEDAIVCARGEHLSYPVPRDLDALRAYFRMGIGLCLRRTERCDEGLARIASRFSRDLSRRVEVQVFVTPGGTHGFGWHFDLEHVFIAQTIGVKDYFFRANTIEPDTPFPPRDFGGVAAETSPLMMATLVAGDFLYIPSRWWHMAECREDALSISVGVSP